MMTGCFLANRTTPLLRRAYTAMAVAVIGLGLALPSPASAQNLVQNGQFAITGGTASFSFGGYFDYGPGESLADWTYVPAGTGQNQGAAFDFANGSTSAYYNAGTSTILPSAITAPSGGNFIAMDANWGGATTSAGISQTISGLTSGASYTLSFAYALTQWQGYTGPNSLYWTAELGSSAKNTGTQTISTQGFSGWATATFTFIADNATETLTFLANGGTGQPPIALLANVSLTKAPEPMSLALFGTGIVALMGVARKRPAAARAV
jgi:hypothetical protein